MDQETKAWDRFGKFILIAVAIIGVTLNLTGNPAGWGLIALAVGATIFFSAIHFVSAIIFVHNEVRARRRL